MAPKMYLLVEADQSKGDPISKLMTQLVDQLKTTQQPTTSTCNEIVLKDHCGAIQAEACIDPSGCTKAKIVVCADKQPPAPSPEPSPCPREPAACPKKESSPCGRRNGLDPTFSEQRGQKKFQYLPLKSNIPDYDAKRCPKPLILSDNLSQASDCDYRIKLTTPVIKGLRETCAKSITEARLKKYDTCISRRNGLQDQCDPLTKRVLRNCCKAKKC